MVWVLSSAYRSPASTTSTVTVCGVSNVSLRGGREIRGRNEPTARVLRQSVGNNQPRRPASDHDVVVARLQLAIEPVRVEKQPPRQGDKEYKEKHWPLPGEHHVARATRDKRIAVATRFAAWDTDEGSQENQKSVRIRWQQRASQKKMEKRGEEAGRHLSKPAGFLLPPAGDGTKGGSLHLCQFCLFAC